MSSIEDIIDKANNASSSVTNMGPHISTNMGVFEVAQESACFQAKLDHYNHFLASKKNLTETYPGFTGEVAPATIKAVKSRKEVDPDAIKASRSRKKGRVAESVQVERPAISPSAKTPREGSKLSQAVSIVASTGKDDKEACLKAIVQALGVTRGNASIYLAKARVVLG